jgi:SAM-dependent methyltransferase
VRLAGIALAVALRAVSGPVTSRPWPTLLASLAGQSPGSFAARALRKATSSIARTGTVVLFRRDLDDDLPEVGAISGFHVRFANERDLAAILEGSGPPLTRRMSRERLRSGDRCVMALDERGELAHTRWLTTTWAAIPELGLDLVLGPREAYFYDGYTRADCRRLGLDGLVRRFIFRELRAAGFERVYSYVRGDNPSGLRAARRWQTETRRLRYLTPRALRTRVLGRGRLPRPVLLPHADSPAEVAERSHRARLARSWFRGWTLHPLAQRSTGTDELPPAHFESTGQFIAETLRLDPERDRVLDVGCDSGMVSRHVAGQCRQLVGVDFVPEMLAQIPQDRVQTAGGAARYVAADGRILPFAAGTFSKAYCSGVIHVLACRDDGLRMIDELVRVCRPGGTVLVAAVPDRAKRRRRLLDIWRRAGARERWRLAMSLVLPAPVKRFLRHLGAESTPIVLLEYDTQALRSRLEARGLQCQLLDFPETLWSRDFRRTRSNLLIHLGDGSLSRS